MRIRKDTELLADDEVLLVADVSDALAHPARIRLYQYVLYCNKNLQPVCTGDLVEAFEYSQATISQHMKKLVSSGLVDVKKQDKFSYYYANMGMLMRYLDASKKLSTFHASKA